MAKRGGGKRVQEVHVPAPVGGLNTVASGTQLPPTDCTLAWNVIGGEYGLRSRLGWREYATGVGEEIRSIIPFTGSAASGANDRLFVGTTSGIWNVTSGGINPGDLNLAGTPVVGSGVLTAGTWYFNVTALFGTVETGPSVETSVVIVGPTDRASMTWDAVTDATAYRVYRGTVSGTYTAYDEFTTNSGTVGGGAGTAGTPPGSPTRVVTFPTSDASSGYGVSTVVVNSAGNHFLCYCDESNGYYLYAESGATWNDGGPAGSEVSGVDYTDLVHVRSWKNRLWFTERDTGSAWYLDVGAVGGAATEFVFGTRFQQGGHLKGLWSWTYDGGSGVDDALVAVSSGGDVLIYKGTDPAEPGAFALSGVWQIGTPPSGRRLATESGGDLLLMSSLGIMSVSRLVTGNSVLDRSQYETVKIANLFNSIQLDTSGQNGWGMYLHPSDAALLVWHPAGATEQQGQLAMSLSTKGWSRYRGLPVGKCAGIWNGSLYFGTDDGRVCINDGFLDGVLLADPSSYQHIDWSLITAFNTLGSPIQKQIQLIRTRCLDQSGEAVVNAEARYGLDLTEAASPVAAATIAGTLWDAATWDSSSWGGGYQNSSHVFGAWGMGSEVAIAVRGHAVARMTLVGMDVSFEVGGML